MEQAATTAPARPAIDWTRWLPAISPTRQGRWRLIRFERIDQDGKPVGRPVSAMTPQRTERQFPNERQAQWAADALNRVEGR